MPDARNMEVDGPERTESYKLKSMTRFCQQDTVYSQKQENGQRISRGYVEGVKQRNVLAKMQTEGSVTSSCGCKGQAPLRRKEGI